MLQGPLCVLYPIEHECGDISDMDMNECHRSFSDSDMHTISNSTDNRLILGNSTLLSEKFVPSCASVYCDEQALIAFTNSS